MQWSTTATLIVKDVCADFKRLALDGPGSRDALAVQALRAAIDEFRAVLSTDETPTFDPDSRFAHDHNPGQKGNQQLNAFLDKPIPTVQAIAPAEDKASNSQFDVFVGDECGVASAHHGIMRFSAVEVQEVWQFGGRFNLLWLTYAKQEQYELL